MKKKTFLTGANGFIGRNIADKLSKKYIFFAPTHNQLDLLNFDSVSSFFQKNGPFDLVIHTAIAGGNRITGDGEEYAMSSMRMFFNIASCEKYFKRFFYFGSGIEYGKEKPIKKVSEADFGKRVPKSNWGLYKYTCAEFAQTHPKFVNLRIFGAFGRWEDYKIRFISNSICKNIFGLPIVINKNIKMDYLYIEDLVRIIDKFINKKLKFNTYNLTPNKSSDLVSISKLINSISGKSVPIKILNNGFSPEYTGSNGRLLNEVGTFNFTNIGVAISELYKWYLKNKGIIDKKDLLKDYF